MSSRVMVRALAVLVVGAAIMTHGLETVALEEIVEQQANEIAELKQKAAQHEQKMTRVEKENARVTDKNAAPYGPQAMDQEVLGQDGEAGKDPAYQCETGMRQCMSLANAVQLREALDASSTAKVQASSESLQSSKKGLQSASSPTRLLHTTWRGTSPPRHSLHLCLPQRSSALGRATGFPRQHHLVVLHRRRQRPGSIEAALG